MSDYDLNESRVKSRVDYATDRISEGKAATNKDYGDYLNAKDIKARPSSYQEESYVGNKPGTMRKGMTASEKVNAERQSKGMYKKPKVGYPGGIPGVRKK